MAVSVREAYKGTGGAIAAASTVGFIMLCTGTVAWILTGVFFIAIPHVVVRYRRGVLEQRQLREQAIRQQETADYLRKRDALLRTSAYSYVSGLADMDAREGREITRLQVLLERADHSFTVNETCQLIADELSRRQHETFRRRILASGPEDVCGFLDVLFAEYADSAADYLGMLETLLREEGIAYDSSVLTVGIRERTEEAALARFEKRLLSNAGRISMASIDLMTGEEFEEFVARLFAAMGYRVTQTRYTGDQGADVVATKHGEKKVIQAKRHSATVGNRAVQEVVAAIAHYSAHSGAVVSNQYFTRSARALAASNRIELIGRDELQLLAREYL